MNLRDIINENPFLQDPDISIEKLTGGNVNQAYKVSVAGRSYFVRINGNQSDHLGLDRALEYEASQAAGVLGISPKVIETPNKRDYMVLEYIDGRLPAREELFIDRYIHMYTNILRTIHNRIIVKRNFSAYDLIDAFMRIIYKTKVRLPDGFSGILHKTEAIRSIRSLDRRYFNVFCHNDFWKNNLLVTKNGLMVIDWEFCGYGDAYFDLCRIPYLDGTDAKTEKIILESYFGVFDDSMLMTLQQMKYIGMVAEATWAFCHAGLSDPIANRDYDYYGFGLKVSNKLLNGHNSLRP